MLKAILILQKSERFPFVYVLICNKSSKSLKNALNSFNKKFIEQFSLEIQRFGVGGEISPFNTASELVLQCFPFVLNTINLFVN